MFFLCVSVEFEFNLCMCGELDGVFVTPVSSSLETGMLPTEKYRIKPSYSKPNKISNTFNKINLKEIHL